MEKQYDLHIKPIIDTFDRLREILRFEKIELPKIVVVGDQSSGKSSVLESITGISLPRGENTVTKCPIILQMRGVTSAREEYANVRIEGSKDDNSNIDLKLLNKSIEKIQNDLILSKKEQITDTPIYVYVRKIGVPDLTLYDLPGITYKSERLTEIIKNIINKYTAGKQTLILLVIPANTDLTTCEAISLIRKNEDYKERTIAIITKIDLAVNQEKDLHKKIMINELNLKYTPIIVRNRTQKEIDNNESLENVKLKEIQLINENNELKQLPEESKGTHQLILRLIKIQKERLIGSKYEIRENILEKLANLKTERNSLPLPADTVTEKLDRFKECLNKVTSKFFNLSYGNEIDLENIERNLGARMNEKFTQFFLYFQKMPEKFFSDAFAKNINKLIFETKGLKPANFFDPSSFHQIISKETSSIFKKVIELIEECREYVQGVLLEICEEAFNLYPNLEKAIAGEVKNIFSEQSKRLQELIRELFDCELECEWTINPYYIDIINKLHAKIKEKQSNPHKVNSYSQYIEINDLKIMDTIIFTPSILKTQTSDEINVLNMQISCFAYFTIFEKRFVDNIQKLIISKFIHFFSKNFGILIEKSFSPNNTNENNLISEDFSITNKRREIEASIANLLKAKEEIDKIL